MIGQSMVEACLINHEQLNDLLARQKRTSEKTLLGKLSIELGLVEEDDFAPFLASYFNFPYVDLKDYPAIEKRALEKIPESMARRLNIMPLSKEEDTLTVAIFDPLDLVTLENLETVTGCRIKPVVSPPKKIRYKIAMSYGIS